MIDSQTTSPSLDKKLFRVSEVAVLLNVSTRTVWRMVAAGELQVVHIRGCTRVMSSQVLALSNGEERTDGE